MNENLKMQHLEINVKEEIIQESKQANKHIKNGEAQR